MILRILQVAVHRVNMMFSLYHGSDPVSDHRISQMFKQDRIVPTSKDQPSASIRHRPTRSQYLKFEISRQR